MDEKNLEKEETVIDFQRLFSAIVSKLWLVALVAVLCAVLAFGWTRYKQTPVYDASSLFYVNNSDISVGNVSLGISAGDISASNYLVKSYVIVLTTRETLEDVIDYAGVDMSSGELKGMISAAAVDETQIFRVTVRHTDPEKAAKIANAIEYILPNRIKEVIDGTSAKVVESAIVPTAPSGPNYSRSTIVGFLIGLLGVVGVLVLKEIFDVKIHDEEDVSRNCKHPILVTVPDMSSSGGKKSRYGYGYGSKRDRAMQKVGTQKNCFFGSGISFTAAEAYKRLRTKLQFSFADDGTSRVIGISGALSGEGKSLTAINLAYSLSQLGKKVILIDCDMRRPSLAGKLAIEKQPGLSSCLSGQSHVENLLQNCGFPGEESAFHVISAGRTPPNPVELLSSERMVRLLQSLREKYDYILLDLPPVCEVSDALAVSSMTDGMLLVVRQNHCDRIALTDALRQFSFVEAKILGVVYNCAGELSKDYNYRRSYYKNYGRREYGKYAAAGRASQSTANKPQSEDKQ